MRVILASASPRRKKLFKKLGIPFEAIPSNIKESLPKTTKDPRKLAIRLALAKAKKIASKNKNALVIGADTIVVLKDKVIGKPESPAHAKKMLALLSGAVQHVITGVAIIDASRGKARAFAESTKVKMKKMSQKQIDYFAKKHLDKAGAYAAQEKSDRFIEKIDGSFSNVVGLPLERLKRYLGK